MHCSGLAASSSTSTSTTRAATTTSSTGCPARMRYPNLVLSRGLTNEEALLKWFWATHDPGRAQGDHAHAELRRGQAALVDVRRRVPGQLVADRRWTATRSSPDRDARDRPLRTEDGLRCPSPRDSSARSSRSTGSDPIECAFNPQSYTVSKTNIWNFKPTTGVDLPDGEFGGGLPRRTTLVAAARRVPARPRPERQGHREQAAQDDGDRRRRRWRRLGAAVRDVPLGLGRPAEVRAGVADDPVRPLPPQRRADPRDRRPRARAGREGLDGVLVGATSQARTRRRARCSGLRVHRVRDGDSLPVDRLRRLRRPDALARRSPRPTASTTRCSLRRGARAHDPEARLNARRLQGTRRQLYDDPRSTAGAGAGAAATASRRSASSTTCGCRTSARSHVTYPKRRGHRLACRSSSAASSRSASAPGRRRRTETLFKGDIVTLEPSSASGGCSAARARLRPRAPAAPLARRPDVPEPDRERHRREGRAASTGLSRSATPAASRTTSSSRTTRPTGTSSGGSPSASASSSWSRTARRHFRQPGGRAARRARVAQDAALLQPARDRRPAGQGGHARSRTTRRPSRRSRPARRRPDAGRADRRRPRERRRARSTRRRSTSRPSRSRAGPRAEALAQALLDKLANGYIAARGRRARQPEDQGRDAMVQVSGVGQKFSGTLPRRHAARTSCAAADYDDDVRQLARRTRSSAWSAPRGGGPPSFGAQLVLGIVTNNDDPDGHGPRAGDAPGARGTTSRARGRGSRPSSAGNERGLLMLPVVGEEVLVGFEHGDTTRPVRARLAVQRQGHAGRPTCCRSKDGSFAVQERREDLHRVAEGPTRSRAGGKLIVEVTGRRGESRRWKNETTGQTSLKATQAFEVEGQSVSIKGRPASRSRASTTRHAQGRRRLRSRSRQTGVQISGPMINIG